MARQNSPFLPQGWPKPSPVLILHLLTEGWPGWVMYQEGIPAKGGHQFQH